MENCNSSSAGALRVVRFYFILFYFIFILFLFYFILFLFLFLFLLRRTLGAGVPHVDLGLQAVDGGRRLRRQVREQALLHADVELCQVLSDTEQRGLNKLPEHRLAYPLVTIDWT